MADPLHAGTPSSPPNADLFRKLAENIREVFWVHDAATKRVIYLNRAFERVTGIPVEQIYRDPLSWRDTLHPEDRERVEAELDRRTLSGEPHDLECRIVRTDGETRWIWMRGVPVGNDAGGTIVVGVAEDITERKRAEQGLARSLSLLRTTLQATADGIFAVDRKGRITTFNDRFIELWRIPAPALDDVVNEADVWDRIMDRLRTPDLLRGRLRTLATDPRVDSFDSIELADGRIVEAYSTERRLDDETDGRVWSFRDVTRRVKAERELRERTRRLTLFNGVLLDLARQRVADHSERKAALERIADTAAEMLGTERVGIWLYERGRESIHQIELFDRRNGVHESGHRISRDEAPSYFAALPEVRALALHDVSTDPRTAELLGPYCIPRGITSMLDAPIRAAGEVVGIVCFEHRGPPRRWTVEEESFAASVADLVAITLEVAERRRAEWGMQFLAAASVRLASSLDYRTTIDSVVQLAVPDLADWCIVDIVENGEIHRVASRHGDPAKEELLRELQPRRTPGRDARQPGARAIWSGESELMAAVDPAAAEAEDEAHSRLFRRLGLRSWMAVPLRARDRILGAITFFSGSRSFDETDLSIAEDLASRAAMAIDNATLFQTAQESSRSKSNFLAVMSHELRTPLNAISGYADLMLEGISGALTDRQRDQLERIKLRTNDLVRIIEEILAFAKMENGGEQPGRTPVDVAALVRRVGDATRPLVEESGLSFDVHVPDRPLVVNTNARRLEHILTNLLSNAVRFTRSGGVDLDLQQADGRVRISVADTGIGIEEENRDRIFEPFFQVEEATTREKGGTGLGLAIARRFARALGGDVLLESEPGRGSTFTVDLPAGDSRAPAGEGDQRAR